QPEDAIRDATVTGVQTCALPIWLRPGRRRRAACGDQVEAERRERAGDVEHARLVRVLDADEHIATVRQSDAGGELRLEERLSKRSEERRGGEGSGVGDGA